MLAQQHLTSPCPASFPFPDGWETQNAGSWLAPSLLRPQQDSLEEPGHHLGTTASERAKQRVVRLNQRRPRGVRAGCDFAANPSEVTSAKSHTQG